MWDRSNSTLVCHFAEDDILVVGTRQSLLVAVMQEGQGHMTAVVVVVERQMEEGRNCCRMVAVVEVLMVNRDSRIVLGNGGGEGSHCLSDLMNLICLSVHSHPPPPAALSSDTLHPPKYFPFTLQLCVLILLPSHGNVCVFRNC